MENLLESTEAVGRIRITKKGDKIQQKVVAWYSGPQYSLEYAPELIEVGDRKYFLQYPLRCLFKKEDDFYVIQSEMLGIIGTGSTPIDAEISFNEEFDFVYRRFNQLDDIQLTDHNILIKNILNQIIKHVE